MTQETVREARLGDVDNMTIHVDADFYEHHDGLYEAIEAALEEAGVKHIDFTIIETYTIEEW